jgi:hypothetical protein
VVIHFFVKQASVESGFMSSVTELGRLLNNLLSLLGNSDPIYYTVYVLLDIEFP